MAIHPVTSDGGREKGEKNVYVLPNGKGAPLLIHRQLPGVKHGAIKKTRYYKNFYLPYIAWIH